MHTGRTVEARESVALAGPADARVIVGAEALAAAGYDPDVFHAVVPSEGMRGGRLNKNGRIYGPPADVAAHHMALVERAREGYVGGWKGHSLPNDEADCPVDAIKLLDGDVIAEEDGSVTTRCLVGILKTSRGDDVNVMWRAGKPTGLSLYGICSATEHTLDPKSPYTAMNPGAAGKTVEFRKLRALEKYDVVFDPSFGTFFADPAGVAATESVVTADDSPEVIAAAERLRASGATIETTSRAQDAQETTMEIKDIKALEAAFPELVKQLVAEITAKAATESTALQTQAAADRERVVALETTNAALDSRLKATESALAQVRADLARKDLVAEIRTAMESWQKGKPGASVIADQVNAEAAAGAFQSAEESVKAADAAFKVAEAFAIARGAQPVAPAAERGGVGGTVEATEGTEAKPQRKSALTLLGGAAA